MKEIEFYERCIRDVTIEESELIRLDEAATENGNGNGGNGASTVDTRPSFTDGRFNLL